MRLPKHITLYSPVRGKMVLKVNDKMVLAWNHKRLVVEVSRGEKMDTIWVNKISEAFKLGVHVVRVGGVPNVHLEHGTEDEFVVDAAEHGKIVFDLKTLELL